MIKWMMLMLILLPGALSSAAQNQRKVLIQQIAALEVYKGYVKVGYKILDFGLKTIGDIKNGDFSLHKDFFNALSRVNPKLRQYPKVAQSIALQLQIVKQCGRTIATIQKSDMLSAPEQAFVKKVLERLLKDCELLLDELLLILTDGQAELKDDERMEQIDHICASMERNYAFVHGFANTAITIATGRYQEKQEVRHMELEYGIEDNK